MAGAWFRGAFNHEPAMMISALLAGTAIAIPTIVVPIRRKFGLPTYQWDADAKSNPYLHDFEEELVSVRCDDPKLIAEWSQHDLYRYRDRLAVAEPTAADRDFPDARARREASRLA